MPIWTNNLLLYEWNYLMFWLFIRRVPIYWNDCDEFLHIKTIVTCSNILKRLWRALTYWNVFWYNEAIMTCSDILKRVQIYLNDHDVFWYIETCSDIFWYIEMIVTCYDVNPDMLICSDIVQWLWPVLAKLNDRDIFWYIYSKKILVSYI